MKWHHHLLAVAMGLVLSGAIFVLADKLGPLPLLFLAAWTAGTVGMKLALRFLIWYQPEIFGGLCDCKSCTRIRKSRDMDFAVTMFLAAYLTDRDGGTEDERIQRTLARTNPSLQISDEAFEASRRIGKTP